MAPHAGAGGSDNPMMAMMVPFNVSVDIVAKSIRMTGKICPQMAYEVREALQQFSSQSIASALADDVAVGANFRSQQPPAGWETKPITLQINVADGDDIFAGMIIYNAMQQTPVRVATQVMGQAYGMGAVIALAGEHDQREAVPGARFTLPSPSAQKGLGFHSATSDQADGPRADGFDLVEAILNERCPQLSEAFKQKIADGKEVALGFADAVKYGLIDRAVAMYGPSNPKPDNLTESVEAQELRRVLVASAERDQRRKEEMTHRQEQSPQPGQSQAGVMHLGDGQPELPQELRERLQLVPGSGGFRLVNLPGG